jgi:hypothetical protein
MYIINLFLTLRLICLPLRIRNQLFTHLNFLTLKYQRQLGFDFLRVLTLEFLELFLGLQHRAAYFRAPSKVPVE